MKVLVITQYFHPEPFRINDLVRGLRDRNHHVTVLTGMPNYPEGKHYDGYGWFAPTEEDFEGVRVIRVPLVSRGSAKSWRLALNYFSFAFFASLLGPLRCRGPFDLIFVFEPSPITVGLPAFLLRKLKRAPIMLWVQDLWPETLAAVGQKGIALAVGRLLADFVHRRCDMVLVQSQAFTQSLTGRGVPPQRIHYLPNWAEDIYKVTGSTEASDELTRYSGFRILFAGNIGSAQSVGTILNAAERLKKRSDIRWLIVGDGIMRLWLEQQVKIRGLENSVVLLGRHPLEDMPALFAAADALLVTLRPDPVFALTIPSKIQSYLASGRLIIGALNGEGARIISESEAGLTCAAGDARGLADLAVNVAAMAPADRDSMGSRGRAYFDKHFERSHLLDQLENWMHQLTNQSAQSCE